MATLGRRALAAAGTLAALLLGTEALLRGAAFAHGAVTFDVGPETGAYGAGFSASEERPPSTFRWTGARAGLDLPLSADSGPGVLLVRYARYLDNPARVHVVISGQPAVSFDALPGRFRVASVPVSLPEGPLRIDILPAVGDGDPGIAVDWVRIEGGAFSLSPSVWGARALVGGVFLIALVAGFGLAGSAAAAVAVSVAEGTWAALDPFGLAHVAAQIALPAVVLGALVALALRRRPTARFVVLFFLAGYLAKGAGLFYPSYFYNDVRNNVRYVLALARPEGTLLERSRAAQVQIGVGYPRIVAGKKYAFPYSPVFFLPFTPLARDPSAVDVAMKHVVVATSAAEVLLVFAMAGFVMSEGAGLAAAGLAAILPVAYSRLLLALWSTTGGHFFDMLVVLAALGLAARSDSRARWLAFGAAAQAALLTYVASLFNVSLFAGALALTERRLARRVLALTAGAAILTVLLLYADFAVAFLREILPAALSAPPSSERVGLLAGVLGALDRIRIFYGFGYPALAVAGFVLLRRRARPEATGVLSAYLVAFLALVAMRALSGGLFKDLKEIEFVAPLVALTAGASLEELAARGRSGRWAAALVAVGLVAFGVSRYHDYLVAWTSLADL